MIKQTKGPEREKWKDEGDRANSSVGAVWLGHVETHTEQRSRRRRRSVKPEREGWGGWRRGGVSGPGWAAGSSTLVSTTWPLPATGNTKPCHYSKHTLGLTGFCSGPPQQPSCPVCTVTWTFLLPAENPKNSPITTGSMRLVWHFQKCVVISSWKQNKKKSWELLTCFGLRRRSEKVFFCGFQFKVSFLCRLRRRETSLKVHFKNFPYFLHSCWKFFFPFLQKIQSRSDLQREISKWFNDEEKKKTQTKKTVGL